jgi:hypothetical protein
LFQILEFEEVKQHWPIISRSLKRRQIAAFTLLYPSNDPHNTYRIDTARHKRRGKQAALSFALVLGALHITNEQALTLSITKNPSDDISSPSCDSYSFQLGSPLTRTRSRKLSSFSTLHFLFSLF